VTDTRPNDPSAAGTKPVLDRLESTHDQMFYWLDELKSLVDHMELQGWDTWARDHARSVIDFFSKTARQHHMDIDRQVLPLVAARGDADSSIQTGIERMRQDHGWIDENWSELLAQLQPVAEGFGGYDLDTLRQVADVFDTLLREHIELEKSLLYPARAQAEAEGQGEATRRAESAPTSGSTALG
jgi:hemerythrin-like domain-containing protein